MALPDTHQLTPRRHSPRLQVPLLIVAFVLFGYVIENSGKKMSAAYAKAGGTATECLFSMRTIAALGIEETFEGRYKSALGRVRRTTILNASALMCSGGESSGIAHATRPALPSLCSRVIHLPHFCQGWRCLRIWR